MANITITAANVARVTGPTETGVAGVALTAGDLVYKDTADSNKLKKVDADDTEAKAAIFGVCLNNAPAADQPVTVQYGGDITIGGTVVVGERYYASGDLGKIAPSGDLASNDYVSMLGIGVSATVIRMNILNTAVQIP